MRKIICCFVILFIILFSSNVYAAEYETNTLIPVDETATVNTEKFDYVNFVYNSQSDDKGNCFLNFQEIHNNTLAKTAVSINLLLFDENKENIGLVAYCSDQDVSSDYSGFKLRGNQSSPFSIKVTSSRYLVEGKSPYAVKYVALMDENKYCHVGGKDNYEGYTIEQIKDGSYNSNGENGRAIDLFYFIIKNGLLITVISLLVVLALFIINGVILNALHKRMYAKTTILAYLPITNFYICVKMAFGHIVAIIFAAVYVLSTFLYLVHVPFLLVLVSFVSSFAFIIDIIKLITKKYDLLYFEPSMKNVSYHNFNTDLNSFESNSQDTNSSFSTNSSGTFIPSDNQEVVDISYSNVDDSNLDFDWASNSIPNNNNNFNPVDDSLDNSSGNNSSNDGGEESDLSKFFK